MSLPLELSKLEPSELAQAANNGRVDNPKWAEGVVERYQALDDIYFKVSYDNGILPPKSDEQMAGVATYIMSLGLVQVAKTQSMASRLLTEISGEPERPGLHEELLGLTSQDIDDAADATYDNPLWAADKQTVVDFFLWYPALYELIISYAQQMVDKKRPIQETLSYINGGLSYAQILVEAGNARLARGLGERY